MSDTPTLPTLQVISKEGMVSVVNRDVANDDELNLFLLPAILFVKDMDDSTKTKNIIVYDTDKNRREFSPATGGGGADLSEYIPLTGTEVGKSFSNNIDGDNSSSVTLRRLIFNDQPNSNDYGKSELGCNFGLSDEPGALEYLKKGRKPNDNGGYDAVEEVYSVPLTLNGVKATDNDFKTDYGNSYSTTEVATGGTWIDGKPIFSISYGISDYYTSGTIGDIENLVDYRGSVKTNNRFLKLIPIESHSLNNSMDFHLLGIDSQGFWEAEVNSTEEIISGYITFEYTKVTKIK